MEEKHASWLNLLQAAEPSWLKPYVDIFVVHTVLVIVVLVLGAWLMSRRLELVPRRPLQSIGEWVYETLAGLSASIIPHDGARYTPVLGTFFVYILALNLCGVVPGFLSPTARLNTTLALGLMAILTAQWVGMRVNGPRYWKRFIPDVSTTPSVRDVGEGPLYLRIVLFVVFLVLKPLLFLIFLVLKPIEELVKPLSLAIRLFGNIFGDDTTIAQFAILGAGALGVFFAPQGVTLVSGVTGVLGAALSVGITAVMVGFALFVAFIQAFVFTLLTGAYITFAIEME
ncbi:MAG TPA: FoF1 ATP synthase subunit a [Armatimonadota bacterium]|jgi:F-type H+-transporting ATPase subunit a